MGGGGYEGRILAKGGESARWREVFLVGLRGEGAVVGDGVLEAGFEGDEGSVAQVVLGEGDVGEAVEDVAGSGGGESGLELGAEVVVEEVNQVQKAVGLAAGDVEDATHGGGGLGG